MADREDIYKRAGYQCELTGLTRGLQLHHIVRRRSGVERAENLILLCWDLHHGDMGVHGKHGSSLDLQLKRALQQYYFATGLSKSKVRELMGGRFYFGTLPDRRTKLNSVDKHFSKLREYYGGNRG